MVETTVASLKCFHVIISLYVLAWIGLEQECDSWSLVLEQTIARNLRRPDVSDMVEIDPGTNAFVGDLNDMELAHP
jgi:hypothetical protein